MTILATSQKAGLQIQLSMRPHDRIRLNNLKVMMDATSMNEVVRRAIHAYGMFDIDEQIVDAPSDEADTSGCSVWKSVHIRLTPKAREILNDASEREGRSLSEIVSRALSILHQVYADDSDDFGIATALVRQVLPPDGAALRGRPIGVSAGPMPDLTRFLDGRLHAAL